MAETATDWYGPETATFGDRVAGAREAAGLSQSKLARTLGVRKDTVVAWEEDRSEPRANKLSAMAGVLNVSIMWLLTGEGEGMSAPPPETLSGSDLSGVLADIRHLRSELAAAEQRAGLLEARIAKLAGEASE
ncbi:helix-turn-helix domain-containing protein [Aestuariivita boseongensis]|uniref:helix-turn-helix domain-containing protein n=1 Tax=Aestuariivita boseongensis TaxID=1470562 RepID=UPI00068282A1|nr:helix-turn-helix domain-containing protein [Aestuariivita boseongensis]